MAKRVKVKDDLYVILSTQRADTHIGKIGILEREKEQLQIEADNQIATIKANLKKYLADRDTKIQKHIRSLKHFSQSYPEIFSKKRSIKLTLGVMGFRKSTKISISKKTTLQKIKDVFKSKAPQYLHIKESPDKEALAKLTDEQLTSVDARRVVTDDFYAEPNKTKMDPVPDGSS